MKKITIFILLLLCFAFAGCSKSDITTDVLTTTAPLYDFSSRLCAGTDITVACLITESVTCLHDYTLQTQQMRAIESAQILVLSGAGLEESFGDIFTSAKHTIDASAGINLLCNNNTDKKNVYNHDHHHHTNDPHIWLSPINAKNMVENIYKELCTAYPQHAQQFEINRAQLISELDSLQTYADTQLSGISTRKLITFHDGFTYLADAFDLEILHTIEEESGREASAAELISICNLIFLSKIYKTASSIPLSTNSFKYSKSSKFLSLLVLSAINNILEYISISLFPVV